MRGKQLNHPIQLIKYLGNQSKTIKKLTVKVSDSLIEKDIHQLRVAIRRTRTALWLLKNSSVHIRIKKLDHKLHRLAKTLGKVRELDVAIIEANQYKLKSNQLKVRRKAAHKDLRKLINPTYRKRLSNELLDFVNSAKTKKPILLNKARHKLRYQLKKQLNKNLNKFKSLHQLRITFKKTRYALEAMGKSVEPIKGLQDILGKAHDLEQLQALTEKNKKVMSDQHSLNGKALPLVKPVIRFTLKNL